MTNCISERRTRRAFGNSKHPAQRRANNIPGGKHKEIKGGRPEATTELFNTLKRAATKTLDQRVVTCTIDEKQKGGSRPRCVNVGNRTSWVEKIH